MSPTTWNLYFPEELLTSINRDLLDRYAGERTQDETEQQFLYKTRKKAFGDFKDEMWKLPEKNLGGLGYVLEDRFSLIFRKLNAVDTAGLVDRFVVGTPVSPR